MLARTLPREIQEAAEMYAGCVSGAILKSEYLGIIEQTGFKNVEVKIEKPIHLPAEVLSKYLAAADVEKFQKDGAAILSITVYGEKE